MRELLQRFTVAIGELTELVDRVFATKRRQAIDDFRPTLDGEHTQKGLTVWRKPEHGMKS